MNPAMILMILKLIDTVAVLLSQIPQAKEKYDNLSAKLKVMVEEDRDPTTEEWEEIFNESDELTRRIVEASNRLNS